MEAPIVGQLEVIILVGALVAIVTRRLKVSYTAAFGPITDKGEKSIGHFWEFAAFAANSVIFIILGINLASQDFAKASIPIMIAITAVILGRAAAVYPCSAVFARSAMKVEPRLQHVLFWGGLRGALALALALAI